MNTKITHNHNINHNIRDLLHTRTQVYNITFRSNGPVSLLTNEHDTTVNVHCENDLEVVTWTISPQQRTFLFYLLRIYDIYIYIYIYIYIIYIDI